jgi:hypothetical protein
MRKQKNGGMKNKPFFSGQTVVWILTLTIIIIILSWLFFCEKDNHLEVNIDDSINSTPEQLQSIRQIGQWEFLSVSDEEMVDTVRKRIFGDDQLVRIYYGTLRLGIDMNQIKMEAQDDTVSLVSPPIRLLDQDFIDETRTKAFYESGSWSARDREALYHKARRKMLSHALTEANLKSAQDNADAQFRQMLKAMGYKEITIRFKQR